MGQGSETSERSGVVARVLVPLRHRLEESRVTDPLVRAAGLRVLDGAERVVQRLERVATTLETAARLEVELLQRLGPVVDDLGELVRHALDEVRARRRGVSRSPSDDDDIIDVEATTVDPSDAPTSS